MKLVVKVERWEDEEGAEIKEIGSMTIRPNGAESDIGDYVYQIDEGKHPLGAVSLRDKGKVDHHPRRQTVWSLIASVATKAMQKKVTH